MCSFKSGVIFKNRVVLAPDGNESHSDLLESLGIRDDYLSASTLFVRVELTPKNNNKAMPVQDWEYIVDQDIKPDWFNILINTSRNLEWLLRSILRQRIF